MINNEVKNQIEKLLAENKYDELIDVATKFIKPDERPPGLACWLGTSHYLRKNKKKKDVIAALNYFEEAYKKGKYSVHGLSGIVNFISVSVNSSRKSDEFLVYLDKAQEYYYECEKYFDQNPEFLKAGKDLFTFQLDKVKIKEISDKIIVNKNLSLEQKCNAIFFYNYIYGWSQEQYTEKVKKNSEIFPNYKVKNLEDINYAENHKIHLGFVGDDFNDQHSISYFLKNTFKYLDKNIFKIFLFCFNRLNNENLIRDELTNFVDEVVDINNFSNQEAVNIIQQNKVNILFDVMGFTSGNRIQIFNSRIAPIQISWLATCNTVGLKNIDYLIADKNVISEDEENWYPEKIIKMPDIWNVHSGMDFDRKFNKSPVIKNDFFTFGSFNNFHKISDEVIETWSKILQKNDRAKLVLKSSSFCNNEVLKEKFKKFGVDQRVEILSKKNYPFKKDHLEVYNNIDLALDTFPYNGVTTTFEALWMGVPVLVLKGFNFNSKCGYSIMKNGNLDELIANNFEEYIELAVTLSENKEKFLEIRKKIFENILLTSLFDSKKFSKNFGKKLLEVYDKINLQIS